MDNLLRNALIIDVETTSLARGAGIKELGIYNLQTKVLKEFIFDPNLVSVTPHSPQDLTKLSSSARDIHTRAGPFSHWEEVITQEVFSQLGIKGDRTAMLEALKWSNTFAYNELQVEMALNPNHPFRQPAHLDAAEMAARTKRFMEFGITSDLGNRKGISSFLKNELAQELKGKTIWIANTKFEATQVGAQLAADGEANNFKRALNLETQNVHSPDPFYVTGREVNQAKVKAQLTGDWTHVWKAYNQFQPKAGETAVRDILDVVKANFSYANKLGLTKSKGDPLYGSGIDLVSHLFAYAEGNQKMLSLRELHRGAEDAGIHESYALEQATKYNRMLESISEGTGEHYIKSAKKGEGDLFQYLKFLSAREEVEAPLQRVNVLKRIHRAFQDISLTGQSIQTTGPAGTYNMKQVTPSGEVVKIPRINHGVQSFRDMDSVLQHLTDNNNYGVDIESAWKEYSNAVGRVKPMRSTLGNTEQQIGSLFVEAEAQSLRSWTPSALKATDALDSLIKSNPIDITKANKFLPHIGLGAAAIAGLGMVTLAYDAIAGRQQERNKSILGYGYRDWLDAQKRLPQPEQPAPISQSFHGMATQGVGAEQRKYNTDFGSPYRGPVVSSQVLENQKLMEERERWQRSQFRAQYYDPKNGIFKIISDMSIKTGYHYTSDGVRVQDGYQGFKGNDLVALALDNYDVTAQDADTVSLRRKGILNRTIGFFTGNNDLSIRLAGVDAPEVSHQGRKAQDGAEEAKAALEQILAKGNKSEVVFKSTGMSYGRPMGALMVDGANMNEEMIKRGYVAHLPYGKKQEAMVNYDAMKKAEDNAYMASRGVWNTDFGQAVYQMSSSKNRPTFNTLADIKKVAGDTNLMNIAAAAESGIITPMAWNDQKAPSNLLVTRMNNQLHINQLQLEMKSKDITSANVNQNNFDSRNGYGALNQVSVLDSTGMSTSSYSRKRYAAFDMYDTNNTIQRERKASQMMLQQHVNQLVRANPINHYRM